MSLSISGLSAARPPLFTNATARSSARPAVSGRAGPPAAAGPGGPGPAGQGPPGANSTAPNAASTAITGGNVAQQTATLNQLLTSYSNDAAQGQSAAALNFIAQQITAAAKTLGQTVTLPQGGTPAVSGATPGEPTTPTAGGINTVV